jgi:peroxiredoxin
MTIPRIGEPARPFRLSAAQGGEIALADFSNRRAVIVWFTKGMACPFCRQQMSQLARAYPGITERSGEVLQITGSTASRAQFYARQFKLPFPYLCDPDYRVHDDWGMAKRSHGPGYYVKRMMAATKMEKPANDFGDVTPKLSEVPGLLADEDMGFFIVDRAGVVRYALAQPYGDAAGVRSIPGPDEIMRELERCATAA